MDIIVPRPAPRAKIGTLKQYVLHIQRLTYLPSGLVDPHSAPLLLEHLVSVAVGPALRLHSAETLCFRGPGSDEGKRSCLH